MPIIETLDLTRAYPNGVKALDRVGVSIERGEWVAVMGPSGSGKSTFLHCLAGLDRPTSGQARVDGRDVAAMDETALAVHRRETVGLVFQQFHLFPYLTAIENVMAAQHFHSLPDEGAARRALERVGLGARLAHRPGQLSGGEQQRVCIARALVNGPKIVLADEPTGNLDRESEKAVVGLLREIHREGTTLVVVTHDPQLGQLADRQIGLAHGRVSAISLPGGVLERQVEEVMIAHWSVQEATGRCDVAGAPVSGAVDVPAVLDFLQEAGHVTGNGAGLAFSPSGEERARDLVRRHRLAEVLFTRSLRVPGCPVGEGACNLEHVLAPDIVHSVCGFLGHPAMCPHGKPIPPGLCCKQRYKPPEVFRGFSGV